MSKYGITFLNYILIKIFIFPFHFNLVFFFFKTGWKLNFLFFFSRHQKLKINSYGKN